MLAVYLLASASIALRTADLQDADAITAPCLPQVIRELDALRLRGNLSSGVAIPQVGHHRMTHVH